ncbi:MAG: rod shape-determining protein MreD [Treponemataceae bacterium]
MIRTIFFAVFFAVFFVIIQTAILSNMYFLPAVPDLLLIVVLYISFRNGSIVGQTTGFITGFILDFFSAAPFGLNALLRTIIGFLAGFFKLSFNIDKYIFPCVTVFFATFVKAFLIWLISIFFGQKIVVYNVLNNIFWGELILNTIFAPIVFYFLSLFASLITLPTEYKNHEVN